MSRSASSFNRRQPRYQPQPTVLILCEDSQSGKNYLEDARAHYRAIADVDIVHCGKTDPVGIVREAISRSVKYDTVYCVIDRDRHPSFDAAKALVLGHKKVKISVSYPCFEYWFLLHFGYTDRPYVEEGNHSPADVLIRDLRKKDGFDDYDKGSRTKRFDQLLGAPLELAKKWSRVAREDAARRGHPNPSTEIDRVLELFETLSKPQLK